MRWALAGLMLALMVGVGGYYFFWPGLVLQRSVERALAEISAAVATQDRAKVAQALDTYMSDSGQVHLEVRQFSLAQPEGGRKLVQEFDKASFLKFMDNILYTLSDVIYQPELQSFLLAPGHKSATVVFTSKDYADGTSYYAGTAVGMRYSAETVCGGEAAFMAGKPLLDKISCNMQLRVVPKPEDSYKLRDPEAIRQLLR